MTSNSDNIGVSDTENGGLSIACSSSGQYRLFTHGPGGIGLSTDSGGNYYYVNDLSRDAQWYSVAMTSDGLLMAAAIYDGTIWISSNYGSYWDSDIGNSLGTAKWTSVTIAGYNTYGGTIYYDSGIFKSTDRTDGLDNDNGANAEILTAVLRDSGKRMYGAPRTGNACIWSVNNYDSSPSWIASVCNHDWISIGASDDGDKVVALYQGADGDPGVYYSSNYGQDWSYSFGPDTPTTMPTSAPTAPTSNPTSEPSISHGPTQAPTNYPTVFTRPYAGIEISKDTGQYALFFSENNVTYSGSYGMYD
jgi:hypothetical protein